MRQSITLKVMFVQFFLGAILIILTVIVHAIILDLIIKKLEKYNVIFRRRFFKFWKLILITLTVAGVFFANLIQIWIWALAYLLINEPAILDFETALYFSTSTFTTAGYGDVVLSKDWRLMGSFQAANGMILFGWSTAFIFEVMSRLYKEDSFDKNTN